MLVVYAYDIIKICVYTYLKKRRKKVAQRTLNVLPTECRSTRIEMYSNYKRDVFDYIIQILVNNNLLPCPSLSVLHN